MTQIIIPTVIIAIITIVHIHLFRALDSCANVVIEGIRAAGEALRSLSQ
jgi:hypothetical protein